MSLQEASARIEEQISEGKHILHNSENATDPDVVSAKHSAWKSYVRALLRKIFNTEEIENEFKGYSMGSYNQNPNAYLASLRSQMQHSINKLESIYKRIGLYDEAPGLAAPNRPRVSSPGSKRAFVVHGHDHGLKETVARLLEKLGLEPVILHELPDKGRTIIEKFEAHSDVTFAIVLLTGDDEGRRKGAIDLTSRARQNVIYELGYFHGVLGRDKVCALIDEGVEQPSDVSGVIFVPIKSSGDWKMRLAKELRQVWPEIDVGAAL